MSRMSLALAVGGEVWPVGSGDALHAMFSTISVLLEDGRWGSRFPLLFDGLYQGELPGRDAEAALTELRAVRRELQSFGPAALVWDADDRDAAPPWGAPLDVPDVTHCFYAADGRRLLDVLASALNRLRAEPAGELRIVPTQALAAV